MGIGKGNLLPIMSRLGSGWKLQLPEGPSAVFGPDFTRVPKNQILAKYMIFCCPGFAHRYVQQKWPNLAQIMVFGPARVSFWENYGSAQAEKISARLQPHRTSTYDYF